MEGIVVLLAFVVAFVGIAAWAYWPKNKNRINSYGAIPFKEDDNGR